MPLSSRGAAVLVAAAAVLVPVASAAPASAAPAALPTVTEVNHLFAPPPVTVGATTVPVVINWVVNTGGSSVCEYDVYRYRNGSFDNQSYVTGKQMTFNAVPGSSYYVYVYPVTCAGSYGNSGISHTFSTARYTESSVSRTGPNWQFKNVPNAAGGRIALNTTRGASFSHYACYTNWAWIAQKGPQGGVATVYVDGVQLQTVNLYSATVKDRQLVAKTFDQGNGCHSIQVKNTSPAGTRNQLTVDGILTQYE